MKPAIDQEYVGSAAKVIGRLAMEALKRHSVWSDDDTMIQLKHIIPDEETRIKIVSQVALAVEEAVLDKLQTKIPHP